MATASLVVLATHPIQYHAPLYRAIEQEFGIPVTVIYGSDFSVAGYRDAEFGTQVRWDTDLLSGYTPLFLERAAQGGAATTDDVNGVGIGAVLRQLQPTTILLTGYQGKFHQRAWWEALRSNAPLLFRAETNDEATPRSKGKQWARDSLLRWLYRRCALLLPIGIRSKQHYQRLAPHKPMIFSPYCIDITSFQSDEAARAEMRSPTRQALGIEENRIVLLFSGKLIPKKDPLLLIFALKRLSDSVRERITVLILGDGELRESLLQESGTAPGIDVRLAGFQNQTALSRYYHAADLMVLPSAYNETWGLVVNEALHHGLPAVVSDRVGCAPDLIMPGKTGDIFKSGSALELASAIERTLPLLGDSATRSRCRAHIEPYSVHRAAEGIATAYQSIAGQAR